MEADRAVVLVLRPAIDLAGVLSEGGGFFYSADGFDDLFDLVQELFGLIDEVVLRVEHGTHDVQDVVAHFLWRPSGLGTVAVGLLADEGGSHAVVSVSRLTHAFASVPCLLSAA
jgi:hypothetical protein